MAHCSQLNVAGRVSLSRLVCAAGLACISVVSLVAYPTESHAQDFCFDSGQTFATGVDPTSAIVVDLDGDGDPDLAVANRGTDNVSVMKNDGTGNFAIATNYTAGNGALNIVAADLDLDGDRDLAVANILGDNVSVLMNNGAGVLSPAANYVVGNGPHCVAAADLDGDNDVDLATPGVFSNDVSVLMNNGDGSFAPAINYVVANGPFCIEAVDLDGDGDRDLSVPNRFGNDVSILTNDGSGTFAAPVDYVVGVAPSGIFAADLDGDTDRDLAVSNASTNDVSVLKNNGDGTFSAAVNYAAGIGPWGVSSADLDADGDQDLMVANFGSDAFTQVQIASPVSVLRNNGDGTFAGAESFDAGFNPASAFGDDLDGDGDRDLTVANVNSDNVSVLMNCRPVVNNTLAGRGVYVRLSSGVSLAFSEVSATGNTSVSTSGVGPAAPSGYLIAPSGSPIYYEISTTGIHSGPITVCFTYDEGTLVGPETDLTLWHLNEEVWVQVAPVTIDVSGNRVCGQVLSLSPFVLAEVVTCACDCHADPAGCNGAQDVTDVVQIVNVAFRGNAAITDPNAACPYERTDVNCTNSTDVLDVVKMVNVAFRGTSAATEFCNPCP